MMSRTCSPLSELSIASVCCSERAIAMRNQPISISHRPPMFRQANSSARPIRISTPPRPCPASWAARLARRRSPQCRQSSPRRIRPPSSGAPGSRLKTASTTFIRASQARAAVTTVGPRTTCASSAPAPNTIDAAKLVAGPARAISRSASAVGGQPFQLGGPAEHPQGDRANGDALPDGHHRVRDLVGGQGRDEQDPPGYSHGPVDDVALVRDDRRQHVDGQDLGDQPEHDQDGPVHPDRDAGHPPEPDALLHAAIALSRVTSPASVRPGAAGRGGLPEVMGPSV